jgi:hypothetical protein
VEIKSRVEKKMLYLFRTTGVFKGTQLVALQTVLMLQENVRRKFSDEGERTGTHLVAGCRMWDQEH